MVTRTRRYLFEALLLAEIILPVSAFADAKFFLITLPVVTLGREGALRAEYNFLEKGTLALEWTEWVGKGQQEELTHQEREDNPGSSLLTEGRDLGLMFNRYTDPFLMSGFHWGLGLSYRSLKANWIKNPSDTPEESKAHYYVQAQGPALSGRIGYRFVGDSVGIAIGSFLGVKHFISQISNLSEDDETFFNRIPRRDRKSLQKKLATSLKIGIEIGWAF